MHRAKKKVAAPAGLEERKAGGNEVRLFKVSLGILVTMATGCLLAALSIQPNVERVGQGPRAGYAEGELTEVLSRLRGTWAQEARARILDEAPLHADRYAGPLRRILRQWQHPLHVEAVEYAGALGRVELRPEVAAQAFRGATDLRAMAVRAADQLGPWASEELGGLLSSRFVAVQVAALETVVGRADVPWDAVFRLLTSGEETVREAAIAAIPRRPGPDQVEALHKLIDSGDERDAIVGLRALARTELVSEFEPALAELLQRSDSLVQLAILDCPSAALGGEFATAVRRVVWDFSVETRVRAKALYCLEKAGSFDATEIHDKIDLLEPRLQYFAARCLIAAGLPKGVEIMVNLVEADDAETVVASRRLLAGLTGASPSSSAQGFRERLTAVSHLAPLPGYEIRY